MISKRGLTIFPQFSNDISEYAKLNHHLRNQQSSHLEKTASFKF